MAPRKSLPKAATIAPKTLILDNGAYTIKAGLVTHSQRTSSEAIDLPSCVQVPNCIARDRSKKIYLADEIERCRDFGEMSFRRPVEKGNVVNWEGERAIWVGGVFGKGNDLECDPRETNLILTESPNCLSMLQTATDEIVFEEFEFAAYSRCLAPSLVARNDIRSLHNPSTSQVDEPIGLPAETCLVIDSGYSHTTVTPLYRGRPFPNAIKRLTVGGKFLTNYLKELISLRQFNMMDETWLINEIKEATCFVSQDFKGDLERTWKGGQRDRRQVDTSLLVDYLLPDFHTRMKGIVKPYDAATHVRRNSTAQGGPVKKDDEGPVLTLGNERFSIPELLFSPSDIGMKEAGLPDVVMQSLATLPEGLQREMFANVVVVGGNVKIPGFMQRLESELRQLVPADCPLRMTSPANPVTAAYEGGARLASNRVELQKQLVTREDFQEHGGQWLLRRFAAGPP